MASGNAASGQEIALKKCAVCHDVEDKKAMIKNQGEPLPIAVKKRATLMKSYPEYARQLLARDPRRYLANKAIIEGVTAAEEPGVRLRFR